MAERTELVTSEAISLRMIEYGVELARDVGATALLIIEACIGSGTNNVDFAHFTSVSRVYRSTTITAFNSADVPLPCVTIRAALAGMPFRVIMANRGAVPHADPVFSHVTIPQVHLTRPGQVKAALLIGLARGLLKRGDRVVCLSGVDGADAIDAMIVLTLGSEPEVFSTFDADTLGPDLEPEAFERLVSLATQLAAEGREGRPVGALFVLGDSERVLPMTRSLVLNPFLGYPKSDRNILDPLLEETIKEFSAIDGAFIIRGDGVVLAAGVQLLPTQPAIVLPIGLGTRHAAAAATTASTNAVAVAISQSTGTVTIFREGTLIASLPRATGWSHLAG